METQFVQVAVAADVEGSLEIMRPKLLYQKRLFMITIIQFEQLAVHELSF